MLSRSLVAARPVAAHFTRRLASTAAPSGVSVSKLDNGITVVSLNSESEGAALGVFVKAGSRYESFDTLGSAHVLKHFALKSTHSLSGLRLSRLIETLTTSYSVESGREGIQYKAETERSQVADLLAVMGDQLRPRITDWELRDQRELIASDRQAQLADSSAALSEAVHFTAYRGAGLGRPSVVPAYQLDSITHEALQQYVASEYVGSRIVVAAVGVEHEALANNVRQSFGYLPAGDARAASSSFYTGGESLSLAGCGSRVAIALQGVSFDSDDAVAARALSIVLGGGVQAKGNPGDGLTSRLYQSLSKNPLLPAASAWSVSYSDSGLFGVQAHATTGSVPAVAELLAKELGALKNVSEEEAARAVALARASVLNSTDTRVGALEFIGKQALAGSTKIQSPAEFAASTRFAVSAADLKRVAKQILASSPTLVATGDVAGVPTLDRLRQVISS